MMSLMLRCEASVLREETLSGSFTAKCNLGRYGRSWIMTARLICPMELTIQLYEEISRVGTVASGGLTSDTLL